MSDHKRDDGIKRRDFINGMLIAAGTASVGGSFPMRAFAQPGPATTFPCDGPIGTDPNVLRGGNQRSVFNIAHWLRDGRLTFKTNSVTIAIPDYQGHRLNLHPVQVNGADPVVKTATFARGSGIFTIPARTIAVFVERRDD